MVDHAGAAAPPVTKASGKVSTGIAQLTVTLTMHCYSWANNGPASKSPTSNSHFPTAALTSDHDGNG